MAVGLCACSSLNRQEAPAPLSDPPTLPAAYEGAGGDAANQTTMAWWDSFNDPALSQIVNQTLAQNLSWQAAKTRVAQAQALLAQSVANQAPQIDLGASVTRQRRSLEVFNAANAAGAPRDSTTWSADAQLKWQWDAFDELKLAQTAATERVQQSRAAAAASRLLVAAQAASLVVQARALRQRIDATQATLAIDTQQLEIAVAKRRAGLTVQVPVLQAQAAVRANDQALAQLQAEQVPTANALAVLAAITPAQAAQWLGNSAQLPMPPTRGELNTYVGVPSQLLLRRPDVLEAQAQVRAASAELATSLAQRYPRFTINAQLGWAAASAAALGTPAALLAALSPSVTWPLLDGGAQAARSDQRRAQAQEAALLYRQAVLRAFAQTESALLTLDARNRESAAAATQLQALREAAQVAQIQHSSGQIDLVLALQTQRAAITAQAAQSSAHLQTLEAAINVYQAVGGGWSEADVTAWQAEPVSRLLSNK